MKDLDCVDARELLFKFFTSPGYAKIVASLQIPLLAKRVFAVPASLKINFNAIEIGLHIIIFSLKRLVYQARRYEGKLGVLRPEFFLPPLKKIIPFSLFFTNIFAVIFHRRSRRDLLHLLENSMFDRKCISANPNPELEIDSEKVETNRYSIKEKYRE